MLAIHSEKARHDAGYFRGGIPAPRAATFCRKGLPLSTWFALSLLVFLGFFMAALGYSQTNATPMLSGERFDRELDVDGNGIEDILDSWLQGQRSWEDLRTIARPSSVMGKTGENIDFKGGIAPTGGSWEAGSLRVICLGSVASDLVLATTAGKASGRITVIHDISAFGGVTVLAGDRAGLRAFLKSNPSGRIVLDRDGTPALDESRHMSGQHLAVNAQWPLGQDWSGTIAILDSGCDTAHNDLGDPTLDNVDGPAPLVGDATDWYDAAAGWPISSSYKVMGWQDVTDDFPLAAGPWDYHYHGTALASVAVGSGIADTRYGGMVPSGRITVVKFYDFDGVWHAWAGDFVAACAWALENRDTYRIRTVLVAVNWDVDSGISDAMDAFIDVGILPVAALGNDGPESSGPGYPAALPGVLTVGSMDRAGAVSFHSGKGQEGQDKPDLLAPGGGQQFESWIITADNQPNDEYSGRQGTSIAAAHVAGAANLLQEAYLARGLPAADSRVDVLDQIALLKSTASIVGFAENSEGDGWDQLPPMELRNARRGWGGLRIDAAVLSISRPLIAGHDITDTLSSDSSHPVAACKLYLGSGIRYLVEAVPGPGLDVSLDIVNPRWLDSPGTLDLVQKHDANGSGTSEFGYIIGDEDGWFLAAVKRVSGEGEVELRLREADSFTTMSSVRTLPGKATSAPGLAHGPNSNEPLIVATSRVGIDVGARSVGVYDASGQWYPQWPVFVFPGISAQGGLSRPLAWDMDGNPGDEIVVASDFGRVYFFTLAAELEQENLGFNLALTNPVGIVGRSGEKLVATVDGIGTVHAWSWGPNLEYETALGFSEPLAPAVGQVLAVGGQELVVSFLDGHIVLLDSQGDVQDGWPIDLGVELHAAPVLLDMNDDGLHEIIQVAFNEDLGTLDFHIFNAQGEYFSGNPINVSTPLGGPWIAVSDPVVAGRYGAGNLRIVVTGVADNGLQGTQKTWHLVNAGVDFENTVVLNTLPSFEIQGTTDEGVLNLDQYLLPPPLTNDLTNGGGGDPVSLVALSWVEDLYGFTTIPGAFTGRISEKDGSADLVSRRPLAMITSLNIPTVFAAAQVPLVPGIQMEATVMGDQLFLVAWPFGAQGAPVWQQERADKINSGAYPLRNEIVAVPDAPMLAHMLHVFPNPGGGDFQFSWEGAKAGESLQVQIYDLQGRHVRTLQSDSTGGMAVWDGFDSSGRKLGAGVYLAVGKSKDHSAISRVVLMR